MSSVALDTLEQNLIGLMFDRHANAVTIPADFHFETEAHQVLQQLIAKTISDGIVPTPAIVAPRVAAANPSISEESAFDFLAACIEGAPSVATAQQLDRQVSGTINAINEGRAVARRRQADELLRARGVEAFADVSALLDIKPAGHWLQTIKASSWHGQPVPPRQELIDGLIPRGTVTTLGGDGGTGKSTIANQLGCSVVTGRPFLGRAVMHAGPVLYISAEDAVEELQRRVVASAADIGVPLSKLDALEFLALAGKDAVLAVSSMHDAVLEPTPLFFEIKARIAAMQPALVIWDTLSDLYGADENKRHLARQMIGLLSGIAIQEHTSCLLLAHPSLSGMSSGSGTSGNTAWNNSVRSRLYFERLKGKDGAEEDTDVRVLSLKKSNYGPSGLQIHVRWQNGVFRLHSEGQSFNAMAAKANADRVFLEMLETYLAEGRNACAAQGSSYAPNLFATDSRSGKISKAALADAMNRLFQTGQIANELHGPPSRQRNRLVVVGARP